MTKHELARKISTEQKFDYKRTLQAVEYLGREALVVGFIDLFRATSKAARSRGEKRPSYIKTLKMATNVVLNKQVKNAR